MLMRWWFWIFLCSSLLAKEEAKFLSLREAIQLALRHNQSIQNLETDRIIQKFNLRIAEREFEPNYALSGSGSIYGRSRKDGVFSNKDPSYELNPSVSWKSAIGTSVKATWNHSTDGIEYSAPLSVSVSQPLLRGAGSAVVQEGLIANREKEAITNQLALRDGISGAIVGVITAYRAFMKANTNIETQRRSLRDAEKAIQQTLAEIKVGKKSPTDNVQNEAQYEGIKLQLTQQINARDEARQNLLETIGLDPNMNIRVPEEVEVDEQDLKAPDLQQSIDMALKNNKDYQASQLTLRQQHRALHIAKNNQLWKLDLSANFGLGRGNQRGIDRAYRTLSDGRNYSYNTNFTLTIPIDDLSAKKNLLAAEISLKQQQGNVESAKRGLVGKVKKQVQLIESTIQQIKQAKRALALKEKSYDIAVTKQKIGRASSFEVSKTQDNVIDAKNKLVDAKIAYLGAVESLHGTMGTTLEHWNIQLKP